MNRHLPAVFLLLCLCLSLGACAGPAETTTATPKPGWVARWQRGFTTGTRGALDAPPAADAERVYVAAFERQPAARWGEQHYLQALDAATGEPLWRADLGGYDAAAPVVAGDTVYVASIGVGLVALDAATGQQHWFLPLGAAELSVPLVAGERVYVAEQFGSGGRLLALDRSSGRRVWAHSLRQFIWGTLPPLAVFGHIYVADGTQLLALSPEDGSMRVVLRADDWITAPPAADETHLYIGAGGTVSAVEQATGRASWTAALPAGDANLFLMHGDTLLVASVVDENPHSVGSGQLTALDRASGTLRWGRALPSRITGLAVAGGLLLSSSLWALDAYAPASGEPAWSYTTGEGLDRAFVVGEQVVLADWAGHVSALRVTPAP